MSSRHLRRSTTALVLAASVGFGALSGTAAHAGSLSASAVGALASSGLPATGILPAADPSAPAVTVPAADVLDVDFKGGATTDKAQGLTATTVGEPRATADLGTGRTTMSFNGTTDAIGYPFRSQWAALDKAVTLECSFRLDAARTASSAEGALCSAKESGGFGMVLSGTDVNFMTHVGGGYKNVRVPVTPNVWHHTVAVWDGATLKLYLDGELVKETPATGVFTPPKAGADSLMLAADVNTSNAAQFFAPVTMRTSRIWSTPLDADQVKELARADSAAPTAATADVLDVDFTSGAAVDKAQNIEARTFGDPVIGADKPMGTTTAQFDGSGSAYLFPFEAQFPKLADAMSVECVFKYNEDFEAGSSESRGNLCGAKEAGGFSVTMYGNKLSFNPHIGGSYRNTGVEVESGRWYHAVGTYDGSTVRLYVNGVLAASTPATGTLSSPSAGARNLVIGADASGRDRPAYFAPATISRAKVFSKALSPDEVLALGHSAFAGKPANYRVQVASTTPAAGSELTRPTPFDLTWTEPEGVGRSTTYALDGKAITPGQQIGAGLSAGKHRITVQGQDVFGTPIDHTVDFTSANVLTPGGTTTDQGAGTVTLSANAVNPSGGKVTTTFRKAAVVPATKGRQGVLDALPTTRQFSAAQETPVDQAQAPGDDILLSTPKASGIPFQAFDVPVSSASDQQVLWEGQVDPNREVDLRVWNGTTWEVLGSARGNATGNVQISADLAARHRHDGVVPVLVTGEDPFADDLPNEIKDSFEKPEDYDFSLAHLTDTQYLSEGAVEQETPEERAVWTKAYADITRWIADNQQDRKIAFTAHTGDVIENWHNVGSSMPNARAEFEVASAAQKTLDDAGMVNTVLPGNHDNLYGADTGPDALFNDYFGPERYDALNESAAWKARNASHHAWKPGDNANNYTLFSAGGLDFVVVSLGFGVTAEETAWADSVLKQYQDRNAIVLTHAYLTPSVNPDGRGSGFSYDGRAVLDNVLKKNENAFLVLSGHEHGVSIELRRDLGKKGNHVVELLADYQFYKVNSDELGLSQIGYGGTNTPLQFGAAFFRLLQFDVDAGEMAVDTYSPLLKNFGATEYDDRKRYNGKEDDTRLPIQLQTRTTSFATDALVVADPTNEVIGTQTVRSGWPARVAWSGLTAGTPYAWQAHSVDAESGEALPGETDQIAMFTAGKAGTDATAPVLTVPRQDTIALDSSFDPMAGVSAQDNADGDLTAKVLVDGTVDTTAPGVYVLTYTVSDETGNNASATRVVQVTGAPAPANTVRPSISGPTTVGGLLRGSTGTWRNSAKATLTAQWLRDGEPIPGATGGDYRVVPADIGRTISLRVTATTAGREPVTATSRTLRVGKAKARVTARAASVKATKRARVKVSVTAGTVPATGTVLVQVRGRTVTGTVRRGSATVTLPKLARGKHKVTVRYLGNEALNAARATTTLKVTKAGKGTSKARTKAARR